MKVNERYMMIGKDEDEANTYTRPSNGAPCSATEGVIREKDKRVLSCVTKTIEHWK